MKKTENNLMMMMTITYDQGGPVVCVTVVALRIRRGTYRDRVFIVVNSSGRRNKINYEEPKLTKFT